LVNFKFSKYNRWPRLGHCSRTQTPCWFILGNPGNKQWR